jgi:hypothetical protein
MLDLLKKTLLVSIRQINDDGEESFDTYFGEVQTFNANTVRVRRQLTGQVESLPYDEDAYAVADPGFYELKDGSTFEHPSFIAQWTVFASEAAASKYRDRDSP